MSISVVRNFRTTQPTYKPLLIQYKSLPKFRKISRLESIKIV